MIKEWLSEPNRMEFKHNGFHCLLNRGPSGAWCGYVAIPKGHPWHEMDYSDIHQMYELEVHGGLTYSEPCQGEICHKTKTNDEVWWIGFDCAHAGDFCPGTHEALKKLGYNFHTSMDTYKNKEYVIRETIKLCNQVVKYGETV